MLIDMANKFLTAAVAGAMLVPSAKAQENVGVQDIEDSTKVEIVDALSRENPSSEKEISLEDAKLQLRMDDVLKNLPSKERRRIKKITKHYWEEKFKLGFTNIVKEVENNPDNYWTFDSKWWYSLNEDSMKNLLKSEFSEYFKEVRSDIGDLVLGALLVFCAFVFGVASTWYYMMNGRLRYDEKNGKFIIIKK